jgi:hypothetical protein
MVAKSAAGLLLHRGIIQFPLLGLLPLPLPEASKLTLKPIGNQNPMGFSNREIS